LIHPPADDSLPCPYAASFWEVAESREAGGVLEWSTNDSWPFANVLLPIGLASMHAENIDLGRKHL
jgi:hypothetical protein